MKKISASAAVLTISALLAFGTGLAGASAEPPLPTLPTGDSLYAVSYFSPKQVATVDVTTGLVTVDPSTIGFSTLQEAEGAGFEVATGKTWLVDAVGCSLWLLNSDGTTTKQFDLPVTTQFSDLQGCVSLMLQQDGTAYITGDVTDLNEDSLFRVNLSDGSLVSGSVKDTAEIAGLSRDPSTGLVWASVISDHDAEYPHGLYTINLQTGQLDLSSQILKSVYNGEDAWDITFDSSGRLWMLTWGDNATLVSLDPDAVNPSSTFFSVAEVRSGDSEFFGSDAIWIPGVVSTPTPNTELANTGAKIEWLMIAGLAGLIVGAGLIASSRRKHTTQT